MNIKVTLILIGLFIMFSLGTIWQLNGNKQAYLMTLKNQEQEYTRTLNFCLGNAVYEELQSRASMPESNITHVWRPFAKDDTSGYVFKTVKTMDTTFRVRIHKEDPNAYYRIWQYLLIKSMPVNLDKLSAILKKCLNYNKIYPKSIYIEYISMKTQSIINHTVSGKPSNTISSDVIPLDIIDTVGVKAYIENDTLTFWQANKSDIIKTILVMLFIYIALLCTIVFGKKIFY